MKVEHVDSDGTVLVTLSSEQAPLLAAALQRAAFQDIPLDLQQQTVVFAEDLLKLVRRAIKDHAD